MKSIRSGVTIYMVLAIILGVAIIAATIALHAIKRSAPPPFLVKQNAVYQMESAILLALQKLDGLPMSEGKQVLATQNIAPAMHLSLVAEPIDANRWRMKAAVESPHWSKMLSALAERKAAATATGTTGTWSIHFLDAELSPEVERTNKQF